MSEKKNSKHGVHSIPSRILVPTDGSENAMRALNLAISYAKAYDSDTILLTILPAPRVVVELFGGGWIPTGVARHHEDWEDIARRLLNYAVSECRKNGIRKVDSEIVKLASRLWDK